MTYTITLDGPGKNALGSTMMRFVVEQLEAAGGGPVLMTGAGDCFCAGLDLKEVASLDVEGMRGFLELFEAMNRALYLYPGPTCALVNGHAIAGGAILALLCDVSVACPDPRARIGLNEAALGVLIPPATFKAIRHALAQPHRETVLLGAQLHPPTEAARLGLISAVSDDPGVWASMQLGLRAKHSPEAYAAIKMGIRGGVMDVSEEDRRVFEEGVLPVWTSDALKATIGRLLGGRR